MAFPTGRPLSQVLADLVALAKLERSYLVTWQTMLSGNISGLDAVQMSTNLADALAQLGALVTEGGAGLAAYAQAQYNGVVTDISADYTAMVNALQGCLNWLIANIPSNSVHITNGQLVGNIYAPAATAPFLTLVTTAAGTIQAPS